MKNPNMEDMMGVKMPRIVPVLATRVLLVEMMQEILVRVPGVTRIG